MRSTQLNDGLHDIATGNFSRALLTFKQLHTEQSDSRINLNPMIFYFYAISSLGALLKREAKGHQYKTKYNDFRKLLLDEDKPSITRKYLAIKEQVKSSISSKYKINKLEEELHVIQSLFETTKKLMKPKEIKGVENAINSVIKNILEINQLESPLRIEYFAAELKKFQLFYSTKLFLLEELEDVEKSYFIRYFLPEKLKQLRKIIDINKTDPVFLSDQQIQLLYKQLQTYQYNKKYHSVFEQLEECILLENVNVNKEYKEFWKNYRGSLTTEKMLLMHKIYSNYELKKIRPIISELNRTNLINEKVFASLAAIISAKEPCCESIKYIGDLISKNNDLLSTWFNFTLDNIPHKKFTDYQFNKYISHIKRQCITDKVDIKKVYLYLDLLTFFTNSPPDNILLDQICGLMKESEMAIGAANFNALCEKILSYKISYNHFITLLNLACELNTEIAKDFLRLIDQYHDDIDTLKNTMNDLLLKEFYIKYPERPLEEVTHEFLTESTDVRFPIEEAELKQLEKRYLDIQTIGEKLMMIGQISLQSELKKCRTVLDRDPKNETALMTLLAIIRIQIKSKLGINPYNMQMLNVLALINQPKRIAQIKTGEGKSALIAMLAAYNGLINHTVDIITTSHDLAIRDAEKFEAFYRSLGLQSSHNSKKNDHGSIVYDKNAILYGTVSDFEFAFLRGETQGESYGRGRRPYDVAIVDEVDSMFIDMQRNQAILSQSSNGEGFKPETYENIWTWINETELEDQTKENLQAMLKSKDIEVGIELAATWLKSARTALLYVEDREYIIDYPESASHKKKETMDRIIKIVNKTHTGEVQDETTRWQGGLHELLEAKHKLQIRVESLTTASISHIEYFNKYKILTGLTGTLGSANCREELLKLYKVTTYDSPPYKPSLKQQIPHLIESDEKEQMVAIQKVVLQQIKAGRPILLLCESIKESKDFYQHLTKKNKSIQLYNGIQTTATEAILGLAGNPCALTIATNLAGRGTDIVTTPEAESHGGLHIIMTFPAINYRVEQQAFGRTGRQGKQGTYQYILHEKQLTESEQKGKTVEEKFSIMRDNREIREKNISANNLINYNIIHKLFLIQTIFFALPMTIKSKHSSAWAKFKTDINRCAMQYTRNETDDLEEDTVTQSILDKLNIFWKSEIAKESIEYNTPRDFINWKLKQFLPDENFKKLLIEGILLLEDPKTDFSSYMIDISIELRSLKLEQAVYTSPRDSLRSKPIHSELISDDKFVLRPTW